MKKTLFTGTICCVLILAAIVLAGCTENTSSSKAEPTIPASTVTRVQTLFANSTSNGTTLTVPPSGRVIVRLNENPTTGFSWNATVSKGLSIVSDSFYPPNSTIIGAGGYHEWTLVPESAGTYTFNAVYIRPWEGQSPTSETFSLIIEATPV
ncbi:MAG: protease inhibitor I42 family protein [Methanoregula sp.]|uniref:protease inhibitor I42 family protein n=1 Tax=Methanoregula sp. TaxID=2052170 RepID=UPI003BB05D95